MRSFNRHLRAAEGYLELGLPLEANEELESISPKRKADARVLIVRVAIFHKLAQWDRMEALSRALAERLPGVPFGWINWSYAARREHGLTNARDVLWQAREHIKEEASIEYALACYECQLDQLVEARKHLCEALRLDESYRRIAISEPDLAPLHREIKAVRETKRRNSNR